LNGIENKKSYSQTELKVSHKSLALPALRQEFDLKGLLLGYSELLYESF
jgi:hypothetical protein